MYDIFILLILTIVNVNLFPLGQEARRGFPVVSVESDCERRPGACEGARNSTAAVSPGEGIIRYFHIIENASSEGVGLNVEGFKL